MGLPTVAMGVPGTLMLSAEAASLSYQRSPIFTRSV